MRRTMRKKNQDGSIKTKKVVMKFAVMTCGEPKSNSIGEQGQGTEGQGTSPFSWP
jgi:hypothetical protein